MIFPGMDPYLENPQLWPGVHTSLIVYLRDQLQPRIRPRYLAVIEERVYLEGPDRQIIPDVRLQQQRPQAAAASVALAECDAPVRVRVSTQEVHEAFVAILDRHAGQRVVTVIEVVSPTNKYAGPGRVSYVEKQGEVLGGPVHLVEIDLLRGGPHVLAVPERTARAEADYDYLVSVNRAVERRDLFELYPRRLRERLPRVRVPLAGDDPDVPLDLQALIAQVYEAGGYADRIDYDRPCVPALPVADLAWATGLFAAARRGGNGAGTTNAPGTPP
jgi:hypothetical protein